MADKFFENNRKKLENKIDNNSCVILFSGKAKNKIGDEFYQFTPQRNFYYMTGIDRQNMIYFMYKKDNESFNFMFVPRFDLVKAKWVGAELLPNEVSEITGINDIYFIDEFYEKVSEIIFNKRIEKVYLDLENRYFENKSESFEFSKKLSENYPYIEIKNVYNIIAEFRRIKEDFEVEKIKNAISITKEGIYSMMKNAKPNMYEYEIEAYFDFELKKKGVKDFAFKSIAASGKNATVLHYSQNNSKTKDGELILFDVGAQFEYYNGDITRTFPVNGKFTPRQKQIYNIVLEGQKRVIDSIKVGLEFKRLNEILKEYYAIALKEIGLIKEDFEVSKYYYHGVSHALGLETHDAGRHNEGLIEKGMVFTVEPGLYIEEEGIGIRIEDNILVTDNGCEVLSKDIIKSVEDIENFMAGKLND
ncbi:MAG: aminopeptidase P family protein [Lachnospirales bacterium]